MSDAVWIFLALLAGVAFGWIAAHETVAAECERLGGFYVGTKVYECKRIATVFKVPPEPAPTAQQEPKP